ncbi:MAG: HEAT-like repeat protein [Pedosphaera sp.]|nr:HEAT-like repeat protein [Pedosphaera sp.]
MRKRFRIVFALLLLAVMGGIAWLALRPNEPVYKGKRLSVWLEGYHPIGLSFGSREAADEAVRQLGTKAIPILLKRLQTKDAPLTDEFIALAQKQHFISIHHESAYNRRDEGAYGFSALGSEGRDAVPALIELYRKAGPECRPGIAFAFGEIGPDAKKAVPLLILGLGDTNIIEGEVGGASAAYALGRIHSEPQMAVLALINCLSNQNGFMLKEARTALGRFGADAKAAVPALINSLNDSNDWVRALTAKALKQIDPEAAAKAGVK